MGGEGLNLKSDTAPTLKVASIQYRALPSNKADNLHSLAELVGEAAANGARIVVLPEMCTTGLNFRNKAVAEALAETIPGPAADAFAQMALRYKIHLVAGLAEFDRDTGQFYNSQILLDPDGLIVGKYRKVHLFGPDLNWAEIGDLGYQAVDTEWGRIGLGICCDINYWELMHFISGTLVDIFAYSTNWVGDELPFGYWSEMLAGCNCYFVAANNWGDEDELRFTGGSTILAPDLSVLSQVHLPANSIIYGDMDLRHRVCLSPSVP